MLRRRENPSQALLVESETTREQFERVSCAKLDLKHVRKHPLESGPDPG